MMIVLLALLLVPAAFGSDDPIRDAEDSAAKWLRLVDGGQFEQSWDSAADMFKKSVSREDWKKAIEGARKPLGSLRSRKVKTSQYIVNPEGAPEGEYVMIQYDSSFDGLPNAVETLTPMKEKDGVWRVSGYFIK